MQHKLDLLIKNAEVVLPLNPNNNLLAMAPTNVGVQNGKITFIGNQNVEATEVFDAKDLTVLPGLIDSQVHFREPGLTHKEDLATGSLAAALGGITTYFEMPNTNPPTTNEQALQDKLKAADGRSWVNYAFYMGAAHDNISELGKLELLPHTPGVKIFLGSSTGTLLVEDDESLEKIMRGGKRRLILHSEDEYRLRERKKIADESKDVRNHHIWRDAETAINATRRILKISEKTGRPVHVLHITTKEEIEMLAQHKSHATVEVLPQHLTLHAPECYERLGTLAQQNPPVREKYHQDALWKGIENGTVDVIGSDHAPHTLEEKRKPYPSSPSGMPAVQTLVPIMLTHVSNHKVSLLRFVEMMSENPRRIFGIQNKGRIAIGQDADFTIVDLKKKKKIENSWIASRCGWTPFDGFECTGWVHSTIVNGKFVMREEKQTGQPSGKPVDFKIF